MNVSSIIVLAVVGIFVALAIWRVAKKGAPCECGGNCKSCGGKKCCCDD